jgi:hypothetical protein
MDEKCRGDYVRPMYAQCLQSSAQFVGESNDIYGGKISYSIIFVAP